MSPAFGDWKVVTHNRKAFLKKHGVSLDDVVVMQGAHEEEIVVVGSSDTVKKKGEEATLVAEALITKGKGVVLFLLTADCLPIAFVDPKKKVIALAHLGWRPSERNLAQKVIHKLVKEFGCDPANILVSVGPGVHKESYVFENPVQVFENLRPNCEPDRWERERRALLETDWPVKSLLRMRLCDSHDDICARMPNPLAVSIA